jgi:hypothetical protein
VTACFRQAVSAGVKPQPVANEPWPVDVTVQPDFNKFRFADVKSRDDAVKPRLEFGKPRLDFLKPRLDFVKPRLEFGKPGLEVLKP